MDIIFGNYSNESRIVDSNITGATADFLGSRNRIVACAGGVYENLRTRKKTNTAAD
jgi:hypothetical protein